MIRDWGLWELTDEDWNEFVPVRDRQKKLEYSTNTPIEKESLAPTTEGKTSDRLSFAPEEGELESAQTPPENPTIAPGEFVEVELEKSPTRDRPVFPPVQEELVQEESVQEESVQEESVQKELVQEELVQKESIQKESIQKELVQEELVQKESIQKESIQEESIQEELVQKESIQKEENLEPIRVASPKVPQIPNINKREIPEIPVSSPTRSTPQQDPQNTGFETVEMKEKLNPPDVPPVSLKQQQGTRVISSQTPSGDRSTSQTALTVGDWNVTLEEIVPLLEKYQLLPKLVREIIIDRALTGIDCFQEELTKAMEGFYQQQQLNSPQKLQAWLQQKQTTEEQLQNAIARSIKLEKFKEQTWGDRLESYFLECKPQLDKVIYSLLRTQDVGVAQELYFRILEGEAEFSDLAKEYSQGLEAQRGGVIGPISLSKVHVTLKEIFQRSQPGQLWSPQYIDNWFVVVRLEKFVPAELDEENRRKLLEERFSQWLQEQYQQVKYE